MNWNPFKHRKSLSHEEYLKKIHQLQRELVPPMHEADTLQGELVRCVSNLDDESKRNGNMNWDEADEEAIAYLREHLCDSSAFDRKEIERINKALDRALAAGQSTEENWFSADEELNYLVCRVVDFCKGKKELISIKEEDEYIGHD